MATEVIEMKNVGPSSHLLEEQRQQPRVVVKYLL